MTRDTNEWLQGTRSSWDSSRFQLVNNFQEFYATRKLIAVYKTLCCFLHCEPGEHIPRHPFLYKIQFIFTQPSMSRSYMYAVSFIFVPQFYVGISCSLHTQLALPSSSLLIWSLIEYFSSLSPPPSLGPRTVVPDTLFSSILTDQAVSPHSLFCVLCILILMFFISNGNSERLQVLQEINLINLSLICSSV